MLYDKKLAQMDAEIASLKVHYEKITIKTPEVQTRIKALQLIYTRLLTELITVGAEPDAETAYEHFKEFRIMQAEGAELSAVLFEGLVAKVA